MGPVWKPGAAVAKMEKGMASSMNAMTQARDHCPDCGHKLHPQELETLFRGKKLDCWYCEAPLKARAKGHLSTLTQVFVGAVPLADTFIAFDTPAWWGYALAGVIILAIHVLPPGLIHGAPWVRIVNRRSGFAVAEE